MSQGGLPDVHRPRGRLFRDFGVRLLSALALGLAQIVALVWGGTMWWALVVAAIAVFVCAEFYAITRTEHRKPNEVFGLVAAAAMPLMTGWFLTNPPSGAGRLEIAQHGLLGLTGVLAVLVVAALVWHLVFRQVTASDTAITVFGVVYVGFTLTHLVLMRELVSGTELVLATLVSVWANDSLAYAIGSPFGRHKIAPRISPKKSVEGLAAGTIGTVAVWVGLGTVAGVQTGLPGWWLAATGLAVSAAAVLGDLAESRLKREAGVKDSGKLLPGHGGFLDRFDSMILVSVVAFYMLVLGTQLFGRLA
jgi:phosphatidate cytidylyltransferase